MYIERYFYVIQWKKFSSFNSHTKKKLGHLDIMSSCELDSDGAQILALTNLAKVCVILGLEKLSSKAVSFWPAFDFSFCTFLNC